MIPFDRFAILSFSLVACATLIAADGAKVVSYYGYDDCIQLRNDDVSVVLCPAAGGRVSHSSGQVGCSLNAYLATAGLEAPLASWVLFPACASASWMGEGSTPACWA